MRTFRRLNDPERYYGLSWRGWLAAGAGGGLLYAAVRVSPLGVEPAITVMVIVLAIAGTALYALSGQALGPGRYAAALVRHHVTRKHLIAPAEPDRHGLVLESAPAQATTPAEDLDVELLEAFE